MHYCACDLSHMSGCSIAVLTIIGSLVGVVNSLTQGLTEVVCPLPS